MLDKIEYEILELISNTLQSSFVDKIMILFTTLGNNGIIWVILCALLLICNKTRYIGMIALFALLLSEISSNIVLKNVFMRNRPFVDMPKIHLLIRTPISYSFPSGHTTSSFAACGVFGVYFKRIYAFLSYILAIIISFSRLYLYVHFLSDVLFGVLLGFLCSLLAIFLLGQYKKNQELKFNVR